MSKRRINKQQTTRIEKIQQTYHVNKNNNVDLADGLIITRFSRHVALEDSQGKLTRCSIRPNIETLVAGDRVIWQKEGSDQGVVVSLYPRQSVLAKPVANGQMKPVAANITQLIIVIAPKPEISWPLLDSYLVLAEILDLKAVILFNKTDLPYVALKEQLISDYKNLGYPIVFTSQEIPDSFIPLHELLAHEVNVFVGQSGVGKSSLISTLLPHEKNIATGALSELSELGCHTTSNSKYYHLPHGGALIDSPGVREFSLGHVDAAQIAQGYKEFQPYLSQCKFRNCTHKDTPHCTIIQAVHDGFISMNRYKSFMKLCEQNAATCAHKK